MERRVHRRLSGARGAALTALAVAGCASADASVLSSPRDAAGDVALDGGPLDGGAAPPCGEAVRIAEGTDLVLGGVTTAERPGVLYRVDGEVYVAPVDPRGRVGSPLAIGTASWVGTPRVAATAGGWQLAIQNHAFAGQWRVYTGAVPAGGPMEWERFAPTVDPPSGECIGPLLAPGHGGLAVAHRCASSIVLARFDGAGSLVGSDAIDRAGAPPSMRRVRATETGWLVLSRRDALEVSAFTADGAARGDGVSLAGDLSELTPAPALGVVVAEGAALRWTPLDEVGRAAGPAVTVLDEGAPEASGAVDELTAETLAGEVTLAWATATDVWLASLEGGAAAPPRRVADGPAAQLGLLPGEGRRLVLRATPVALDLVVVCD